MSTAGSGLRSSVIAAFVCGLGIAPAFGQDAFTPPVSPLLRDVATEPASSFIVFSQTVDAKSSQRTRAESDRSSSPILMTALHSLTVTSHILDVHSTLRAIDSGAVEGNPLMVGLSGNRAALIAVKTTLAAGLIYATHRIAKRSKAAAIVGSVAVNSLLLTAAHHNYSIARQVQSR